MPECSCCSSATSPKVAQLADTAAPKQPKSKAKPTSVAQAADGAKATGGGKGAPDAKGGGGGADAKGGGGAADGGTGAKLIDIARTQVGTMTGDAGKYIKAGGGSGAEPWCGDFVEWVAQQAGIDKPPARSTGALYDWAKSKGKLTKTPSEGDLVIYDWEHDGTPSHVGFVVSKDGNTLHTIEGNTSTTKGGLGVAEKTRDTSDVIGYVDIA
jgi:cell wall-associated NlpC family hydrolase